MGLGDLSKNYLANRSDIDLYDPDLIESQLPKSKRGDAHKKSKVDGQKSGASEIGTKKDLFRSGSGDKYLIQGKKSRVKIDNEN
jgi:hypothetical protein